MKKKLLAIFLCLLMVFAMGTPGIAVAETTGETESTADEPVQAVSFTRVAPLVKEAAASPIARRALKAAAQVNDAVTNTEGDLILDKKATTVNGKTTIRLEVYSTGSSTTTVSTEPVDIVLVLDVSGSMDDPMESYTEVYPTEDDDTYYYKDSNGQYKQAYYCDGMLSHEAGWYTKDHGFLSHGGTRLTPKTGTDDTNTAHTQFYVKVKRIDALKTAVNSFIDNVSTKSPDSSIAIVKFAGDRIDRVGNDTYREGGYTYNYSQIVSNLTAVGTGASTLKSAVNALRPAGATAADYGMQHAQTIVNGAKDNGRKKVVIMFTDGEPNHQSGFDSDVANDAIKASKSIKNSGATVYTIGVFSGANGTPVTSWNGVSNTNKYMHLVSSNYKNAQSMNTPGEATYPEGGKSYFLSAANASDVMNIFTQISQEVGGTTTELTQTSVIKDIVTPYFDLPANASDVTLKVAPCDGVAADGTRTFGAETAAPNGVKATIDQANNMVSVTGFNFKDEWCGTKTDENGKQTPTGNKLIIEFVITPKKGFLGGNDVVTNGENSGVYKDANATEPEKTFPVPKTDVKIDEITFDVTTNYTFLGAYAGNTVTQGDMKFNTKVMCNGVEIDLSKADYGLEDWQHEYVDIKTELKDANGNVIPESGLSGLYADTTFTMKVTVSPKTTGSATEQSHSETRDIKVFLPHVTFRDSEIALGTTAPKYDTNNWVETEWKLTDGTTEQEVRDQNGHIVNNGVAPTLTFTYDPVEGAFTTDTPVKVTVTMPTTGDATKDVTQYVKFHHDTCTFANCKWDDYKDTHQFIVHVKSFDLTITKTVDTVEPNQTFLFHIKKDNADYMDVTVQVGAGKTGSVTIKGLPVGSYTVTEDAAWSWRYALQGDNDRAVDLNSGVNGVVTVKFENKLDKHTWLSGETSCENRWSGNRILKNGQPLDNN